MGIDWQAAFVPRMSLLELVLRGTVMYLGLLAVMRILVRREIGSLSLMDLLLLVLIADAAQNGMSGDYKSVPEGFVLCGTIIGWNYVLDYLAYRFRPVRRLLEGSPLCLVRDGQLQRRNMQKEFITKEEILSQLREQGIEHIEAVKRAFMEPDGKMSVIPVDSKPDRPKAQRKDPPV